MVKIVKIMLHVFVYVLVTQSLWPHGLYSFLFAWNFPGKNTFTTIKKEKLRLIDSFLCLFDDLAFTLYSFNKFFCHPLSHDVNIFRKKFDKGPIL